MRRIVFLVAALGCVAACRHEGKRALPACSGELGRNDVMRLQAAVRSGTDPCPELGAPKVVLDSRGVSVDGMIKVATAEMPHSAENIAPLFQSFEAKRRLWKQIHPGDKFSATVDFTASPDAQAVSGASVIRSVAWAGYGKIHLVAGDVTVDFDYMTPRPPGAPEDAEILRVHDTGTMHDLATAVKDALATPAAKGKREVSFEHR